MIGRCISSLLHTLAWHGYHLRIIYSRPWDESTLYVFMLIYYYYGVTKKYTILHVVCTYVYCIGNPRKSINT